MTQAIPSLPEIVATLEYGVGVRNDGMFIVPGINATFECFSDAKESARVVNTSQRKQRLDLPSIFWYPGDEDITKAVIATINYGNGMWPFKKNKRKQANTTTSPPEMFFPDTEQSNANLMELVALYHAYTERYDELLKSPRLEAPRFTTRYESPAAHEAACKKLISAYGAAKAKLEGGGSSGRNLTIAS